MKLLYVWTLGCAFVLFFHGCTTVEKNITDVSTDQTQVDGGVEDTSILEDFESIDASPDMAKPDTHRVIDLPNEPDIQKEKEPLAGMCAKDADCESDFCITEFLGGYCTQSCDNTPCPSPHECHDNPKGEGKICFKHCESADDCRTDQLCIIHLCQPRCQPSDCPPNYKCSTEKGVCVYAPEEEPVCEPQEEICDGKDNDCDNLVDDGCNPDLNVNSAVTVVDLGIAHVGKSAVTHSFPYYFDNSYESMTLLVLGAPESYLSAYYLTGPGNVAYIDYEHPEESLNPYYPALSNFALMLPTTPKVGTLSSGPYHAAFVRYYLGQSTDPYVDLKVYLLLKELGSYTTGTVDVNMHFIGLKDNSGQSYPSTRAQSDTDWTYVIDVYKEILGKAGLSVGNINYYDITGADGTKYAYADISGETLGELTGIIELANAHPTNNYLNIYLVMDITDTAETYGTGGISGGIPGIPYMQGSYGSGILLSMESFFQAKSWNYADYLYWTGFALAHETGHYLGLWHTTEYNGEGHDPLDDTPECAPSNDSNGDGYLEAGECGSAKGSTNMMFWMYQDGNTNPVVTANQKFVMLRHPQVRHP